MVRDAPRETRATRELQHREPGFGEDRAREAHRAWRSQRALYGCGLSWRVAKQIDAAPTKERASHRAFPFERPQVMGRALPREA